jgi:hypothetical protein
VAGLSYGRGAIKSSEGSNRKDRRWTSDPRMNGCGSEGTALSAGHAKA